MRPDMQPGMEQGHASARVVVPLGHLLAEQEQLPQLALRNVELAWRLGLVDQVEGAGVALARARQYGLHQVDLDGELLRLRGGCRVRGRRRNVEEIGRASCRERV